MPTSDKMFDLPLTTPGTPPMPGSGPGMAPRQAYRDPFYEAQKQYQYDMAGRDYRPSAQLARLEASKPVTSSLDYKRLARQAPDRISDWEKEIGRAKLANSFDDFGLSPKYQAIMQAEKNRALAAQEANWTNQGRTRQDYLDNAFNLASIAKNNRDRAVLEDIAGRNALSANLANTALTGYGYYLPQAEAHQIDAYRAATERQRNEMGYNMDQIRTILENSDTRPDLVQGLFDKTQGTPLGSALAERNAARVEENRKQNIGRDIAIAGEQADNILSSAGYGRNPNSAILKSELEKTIQRRMAAKPGVPLSPTEYPALLWEAQMALTATDPDIEGVWDPPTLSRPERFMYNPNNQSGWLGKLMPWGEQGFGDVRLTNPITGETRGVATSQGPEDWAPGTVPWQTIVELQKMLGR